MAARRTPSAGTWAVPRKALIAGLAVLLVLTGALAWFALSYEPKVADAGTVPTQPSPSVTPTPELTPEPEPEPVAAPNSPVMQRLLAAAAGGQVLRAMVGACPAPAGGLEVSFDAGATWQAAATETVAATRLLQLDTSDPAITRMVSLNAETCAPQAARSFVGGTSWQAADLIESPWYIDPADAGVVHTPAGAQAIECPAVGLASSGSRAAVLCENSSVRITADGGASWSAPAAVPYAAAVGVTPTEFVVASAGEPECAGARTRLVGFDFVADPGACVAAEGATEGNTAVTGAEGQMYIWTGNTFARSFDAGATWQ